MSSENFGRLDSLACHLFLFPGVKFVWATQEVERNDRIKLHYLGDTNPTITSHPGGTVFVLKEKNSSDDVPPHFPYSFIAPSIVTLSEEDILHMSIDNNKITDSADWPGMDSVLACPLCQQRAVADSQTHYVMTSFPAIMNSHSGHMASKLLFRMFCIPCFEVIDNEAGGIKAMGPNGLIQMSGLDVVRRGDGAPFEADCSGDEPRPAYARTNSMITSGFHAALSADVGKFVATLMGARKISGKKKTVRRGTESSTVTKYKVNLDRLTDKCWEEGCELRAFDLRTEGEPIQPLKTCTGCKIAKYCSRKCQKAHWRAGHKKECKQLAQSTAA